MTETEKPGEKRVWSGYECPACFAVFRVPKGNEHREAICPQCETILRLVEGAPLPALPSRAPDAFPMTAAATATPAPPSPDPGRTVGESREVGKPGPDGMVRKRRKVVKTSLDPDWERTEHAQSRKHDSRFLGILFLSGLVILISALALMQFFRDTREPIVKPNAPPSNGALGLGEDLSGDPAAVVDLDQIDLATDEARILEAINRFLGAQSVEEVLRLSRPSKELKARTEAFYARHPYAPTEVRAIAEDGEASVTARMVSMSVTLPDYTVRPIALEKVNGRFLVDWESWVGYSDLDWDRFVTVKPRKGRDFRVIVSKVDYYNFDFSDESQWVSYRLSAPHSDTVVYGYIPRSSPLIDALTPVDPSLDQAAMILKLRFPLKSKTDNQVLIDEVVSQGWVEGRLQGAGD